MLGLKKMQNDLLEQGIMISQMKNQIKEIKDELSSISKMLEQVLVKQDEAKPKAKAPAKPKGRPRKKE